MPLLLAIVSSLIGVAAALINEAEGLRKEADAAKREQKAWGVVLASLPRGRCLASISFDIWVMTTLFSADPKTLAVYNLGGKSVAMPLVLVSHIFFYITVLAWGGVIGTRRWDIVLGLLSILFCVLFQAY